MFVLDEIQKQPLKKLVLNYRAATKATNFGSKSVEPKTKQFT